MEIKDSVDAEEMMKSSVKVQMPGPKLNEIFTDLWSLKNSG
jgi:hypothetical protein